MGPPANITCVIAEFRGPGVHHRYDDSPEDLDMDIENSSSEYNNGPRTYADLRRNGGGRIILLGNGSDWSTSASGSADDEDDSEMFDNDDEDADVDNQVQKGGKSEKEQAAREETPAPESKTDASATSESAASNENEGKPKGSSSDDNAKVKPAIDGVLKERDGGL